MEEEVEEEYKAAATVDSRRACPSGCPRAVRGGVTATRRQAALGMYLSVLTSRDPSGLTLPKKCRPQVAYRAAGGTAGAEGSEMPPTQGYTR